MHPHDRNGYLSSFARKKSYPNQRSTQLRPRGFIFVHKALLKTLLQNAIIMLNLNPTD